ncbi:hypothetical protein [Cellulomonas sp. P5_C5]
MDPGTTTFDVYAYCVASGGYRTIDRTYRAGPMKTGGGYPIYCSTGQVGTSTVVAKNSVSWGQKTIPIS